MELPIDTLDDYLRIAREDIIRSSLTSAERILEQAILRYSDSVEAFYLLGCVYAKKSKFKKAVLAYERALKIDPSHTETAIALSGLYNDLGRYREAATVFLSTKRRLSHLAPGHDPKINDDLAQRHYDLGQTYFRYERYREAYHEFAKALNLSPDNSLFYIQMAKCLSKTGDKHGAVDLLRKMRDKQPKNIEVKIQLGIIYHSLARLGEARKEWEEALTIDPNNRSAQMYLKMIPMAGML